MPQKFTVEGVGTLEFPDDAKAEEIQQFLDENYNRPTSTALGAAARGAATSVVPTGVGMAAAAPLMPWATAAAPATYGASLLVPLAVGGVAGFAAGEIQESAIESLFPELEEQLRVDIEQHPYAAAGGRLAAIAPFAEFAPGQSVKALASIPAALRGAPEAQRAVSGLALNVGLQEALTAGQTLAAQGRLPTGLEAAEAAVAGGTFTRFRGPLGRLAKQAPEAAVAVEPRPEATPEVRAAREQMVLAEAEKTGRPRQLIETEIPDHPNEVAVTLDDGSVIVSKPKLHQYLEQYVRADRKPEDVIEDLVFHESVHGAAVTLPEGKAQLSKFWNDFTWLEKKALSRIILGPDYKGPPRSDVSMGHEASRYWMQRAGGMDATEFLIAARNERMTVQLLDKVLKLVRWMRNAWGTEASQRQLDYLDRIETNLNAAKKGVKDALVPETAPILRPVREAPGEVPEKVPTEKRRTEDDERRRKESEILLKPEGTPKEGITFGTQKPMKGEVITASAFVAEDGTIHSAPNHPTALQKAGVTGFETRESRNTPQFGYVTNRRPFVSRDLAGKIAERSRQKLTDFEFEGQPHSDEIQAPGKPGIALGDVPEKAPPAAQTVEGPPATPAEVAAKPGVAAPEGPAIRQPTAPVEPPQVLSPAQADLKAYQDKIRQPGYKITLEDVRKLKQLREAAEVSAQTEIPGLTMKEIEKLPTTQDVVFALGRRVAAAPKTAHESGLWKMLKLDYDLEPGGAVIISDRPSEPHLGRIWWDRDGNPQGIEINSARVRGRTKLGDVFEHELGHWFDLTHPDEVTNSIIAKVSKEEWRDIYSNIKRLGYDPGRYRLELRADAIKRLADSWKGRSWWERLLGRVSAFASEKLGVSMTRAAAERAAIRALATAIDSIKTVRTRDDAILARAMERPEEIAPELPDRLRQKLLENVLRQQRRAMAEKLGEKVTEENLDRVSRDSPGEIKHGIGIEYGITLSRDAVPRLEQKYKDSQAAMLAAFKRGDEEAQLAEFAKSIFYGGALQGATRGEHPVAAGNYAQWLRQQETPGVTMKEFGTLTKEELQSVLTTIIPARGTDEVSLLQKAKVVEDAANWIASLPPDRQIEGLNLISSKVESERQAATAAMVAPKVWEAPPATSAGLRSGLVAFLNQPVVPAKAKVEPVEPVRTEVVEGETVQVLPPVREIKEPTKIRYVLPTFARWASAIRDPLIYPDITTDHLRLIWDDMVPEFLNNASKAKLEELRKSFGLEYGRFRGEIPEPDTEPVLMDILKANAPPGTLLPKLAKIASAKGMTPDEAIRWLVQQKTKADVEMARALSTAPTETTVRREGKIEFRAARRVKFTREQRTKLLNEYLKRRVKNYDRRHKLIGELHRRMIMSARTPERNILRKSITLEDVAFENNDTEVGAYREFSEPESQDRLWLTPVLVEESAGNARRSKRAVLLVNKRTLDEDLVSVYFHHRTEEAMVYDPRGLPGDQTKQHFRLIEIMPDYKVAATVLLRNPIHHLHQRWTKSAGKTAHENFVEQIGREAGMRESIDGGQAWMDWNKVQSKIRSDRERAQWEARFREAEEALPTPEQAEELKLAREEVEELSESKRLETKGGRREKHPGA